MKKKKKDKEDIEFFPVQNIEPFCAWKIDISESSGNEFLNEKLPKGKYDIDYVINLLSIIVDNCGPLSSILSIKESCKRLIGYLKVEKCPVHEDPRILVTCDFCRESVVLPKSISHHWKCPCIKNGKLLD